MKLYILFFLLILSGGVLFIALESTASAPTPVSLESPVVEIENEKEEPIIAEEIELQEINTVSNKKETITLSDEAPHQGDALFITLIKSEDTPEKATFGGKTTAFFEYQNSYRAVFPIEATKPPGNYVIKIETKKGEKLEKTIQVAKSNFKIIDLPVPESLNMTPETLSANLVAQKQAVLEVVTIDTDSIFFTEPFDFPLKGFRTSSEFGEVRKTGNTEARHLGVDFVAPIGTPIYAINSGIVRQAYSDPTYGNTVLLDHGRQIFSLYLHMNEIKVGNGDVLQKGDIVGTVGMTGLSTAAHLHLSIKIAGISVDPIQFIEKFK